MPPELLHPRRPATAPPRWIESGECATADDPELFFPLDEDGPGAEAAKRLCAGCGLRECCLAYALAAPMPAGVWGGLSTTERDALVRTGRSPRPDSAVAPTTAVER